MTVVNVIQDIINNHQQDLLKTWEDDQKKHIRGDLLKINELREQLKEFLGLFTEAAKKNNFKDMNASEWSKVREFLNSLSYNRGLQGFTPSETALFVFTLKKSLVEKLREKITNQASTLNEIWEVGDFLDKLGLYTTEVYQKAREDVITRQQNDMLELSTPVVELAEGIIALPMIGTLDSSRTSIVMETLLQRIVETGADIAIIDITGVPTVDTLVAQHLLKTVTAARLMGAECIISGIRPQIAATIVHLGVELNGVTTKASLASAFNLALKKTGHSLVKTSAVKA
jgi:rsbT co-antagonist protein RsbR